MENPFACRLTSSNLRDVQEELPVGFVLHNLTAWLVCNEPTALPLCTPLWHTLLLKVNAYTHCIICLRSSTA